MRPTDHRPPPDPAVYVVKRTVYAIKDVLGSEAVVREFRTEAEARRVAAFNRVLRLKNEFVKAMTNDGAPPTLSDPGSIAAWLVDNRAVVREVFDRADAAEAEVLLIPLLDGAEPPETGV